MSDSKKKTTKKTASKTRARRNASRRKADENRGMRQGAESLGYLALAGLALILLNVAVSFMNFRVDLTHNRRFSLADGSVRLVSELEDTLTIYVYFTTDLPPPQNRTERTVRNLLEEYESAGSNIVIEYIDMESTEGRDAAGEHNVPEVPVGSTDGRSANVTNVFRGIVLQYGGATEAIPVVQDEQGLEYEISSRIRQLTREPLPVGIVEGHGSPSLTEGGLARFRTFVPSYELRPVNVAEEIAQDLRALIIIAPTEPFTEPELRRINAYVMNGGSLGIFGGVWNIEANQMGMTASRVDTQLNTLMSDWGIQFGRGMVLGMPSIQAGLRGPFGNRPVPYPPAPRIPFNDEEESHPAIFRLNEAVFAWAAPIHTSEAFEQLEGSVLASSLVESNRGFSWLLTDESIPIQPRMPQEWQITEHRGPHIMLVSITNTLPSAFAGVSGDDDAAGIDAPDESTVPVRLLVSGSSSAFSEQFIPPAEAPRRQALQALAFPLNAIDWLANDADLVAIRAKDIQPPMIEIPMDSAERDISETQQEAVAAVQAGEETVDEARSEIEEAEQRLENVREQWDDTKLRYQLAAVGLPPFLAMLFGVGRFFMRKNKRANLKEMRKRLSKKDRG